MSYSSIELAALGKARKNRISISALSSRVDLLEGASGYNKAQLEADLATGVAIVLEGTTSFIDSNAKIDIGLNTKIASDGITVGSYPTNGIRIGSNGIDARFNNTSTFYVSNSGEPSLKIGNYDGGSGVGIVPNGIVVKKGNYSVFQLSSDGTPQINMGTSDSNKVQLNETGLKYLVNGVTAFELATNGNPSINLTNGLYQLTMSGTGIALRYNNTNYMSLSDGNASFTGNVNATSGNFTGSINATSGNIAETVTIGSYVSFNSTGDSYTSRVFVNETSNNKKSAGVFKNSQASGYGVVGWATSTGTGETTGLLAIGVYGVTTSYFNTCGVYGFAEAAGFEYMTSNSGVRGYGNRGGVFQANGASNSIGLWVSNNSTSIDSWGGHFRSKKTNRRVVKVEGWDGANWVLGDIEAAGFYPFTGLHICFIDDVESYDIGDIAIDTGVLAKHTIVDCFGVITVSTISNQKGGLGIISTNKQEVSDYKERECEYDEEGNEIVLFEAISKAKGLIGNYKEVGIASVGEGQINVCGEGGDIEVGDLIVTSNMKGKGMKQTDDIIRGYTVAKSRENVTFSSPTEVKQIACIYLAG